MLETLDVIGEKLLTQWLSETHHHGDYQLRNTSVIGLYWLSENHLFLAFLWFCWPYVGSIVVLYTVHHRSVYIHTV